MAKTKGKFILYIPKMQIHTFKLLKVFNLLIDLEDFNSIDQEVSRGDKRYFYGSQLLKDLRHLSMENSDMISSGINHIY